MREFTKEQLAEFDGQKNPEKYVAVDGVVYDLTNVPAWSGDNHHGNVAGQDLSIAITHSPHGKKFLDDKPVVGKYIAKRRTELFAQNG
ncbi:cytochrome b5 domain-containing protein [Lacticaseibacillus sharpeae]|uniref:cytochrome b5 domain-containing protein n=1 Tax=Lacticaseibacillus sharpeae TaxID=1626 RepID=UPI0006D148BA|nr:cytochrome b5 domain-containing protein [Lacticaseibacillus sharpeae]